MKTSAAQPCQQSTIQLIDALYVLRCGLYDGQIDGRLHRHVTKLESLLYNKATRAQ